jgi:hypothetical protein
MPMASALPWKTVDRVARSALVLTTSTTLGMRVSRTLFAIRRRAVSGCSVLRICNRSGQTPSSEGNSLAFEFELTILMYVLFLLSNSTTLSPDHHWSGLFFFALRRLAAIS